MHPYRIISDCLISFCQTTGGIWAEWRQSASANRVPDREYIQPEHVYNCPTKKDSPDWYFCPQGFILNKRLPASLWRILSQGNLLIHIFPKVSLDTPVGTGWHSLVTWNVHVIPILQPFNWLTISWLPISLWAKSQNFTYWYLLRQ